MPANGTTITSVLILLSFPRQHQKMDTGFAHINKCTQGLTSRNGLCFAKFVSLLLIPVPIGMHFPRQGSLPKRGNCFLIGYSAVVFLSYNAEHHIYFLSRERGLDMWGIFLR